MLKQKLEIKKLNKSYQGMIYLQNSICKSIDLGNIQFTENPKQFLNLAPKCYLFIKYDLVFAAYLLLLSFVSSKPFSLILSIDVLST